MAKTSNNDQNAQPITSESQEDNQQQISPEDRAKIAETIDRISNAVIQLSRELE